MRTWEEYLFSDGVCRWENEYHDEVRVRYEPEEDEYHVRYKPARSDIITVVPNGRKDTRKEAVQYAVDVVMGRDRIRDLGDWEVPVLQNEDMYDRQAAVGEYVDPGLLSVTNLD